jgi:hypothetical protein
VGHSHNLSAITSLSERKRERSPNPYSSSTYELCEPKILTLFHCNTSNDICLYFPEICNIRKIIGISFLVGSWFISFRSIYLEHLVLNPLHLTFNCPHFHLSYPSPKNKTKIIILSRDISNISHKNPQLVVQTPLSCTIISPRKRRPYPTNLPLRANSPSNQQGNFPTPPLLFMLHFPQVRCFSEWFMYLDLLVLGGVR